jgi:putative transposase
MGTHRKTYRFRMRPTKAHEENLLRMAGMRRFAYNWALERRQEHYQQHGAGIPKKPLSSELTALRNQPGTVWLKGVDSQALQQALRDLDRAFEAFFLKRARYPCFRSKKRHVPTFRIPQRIKVENECVCVPKIGWLRIRQSQTAEGTMKGATFRQTATGKWFVTLTTEFELPDAPLPLPNPDAVRGSEARFSH